MLNQVFCLGGTLNLRVQVMPKAPELRESTAASLETPTPVVNLLFLITPDTFFDADHDADVQAITINPSDLAPRAACANDMLCGGK